MQKIFKTRKNVELNWHQPSLNIFRNQKTKPNLNQAQNKKENTFVRINPTDLNGTVTSFCDCPIKANGPCPRQGIQDSKLHLAACQ